MSSSSKPAESRVVITGVGLISPLGSSADQLWAALSAGKSGITSRESGGPPQIVAEAGSFSGAIGDFGDLEGPQKKAIRKGLKLMCRETQMAVASAQLAIANAGASESFDPERVGVVLGSDYMLTMPEDYADAISKCADSGEFDFNRWGDDGLGDMQPLWMLKYLPNMPASHIAIYNDLRGPNNSLTLREASGLAAIGEAVRIIARGGADRMIAGATGTRVLPMQAIHALQTEAIASGNHETASRPFDLNRTGMVCGEGAAMVVLETLEAAKSRGATIWGEVLGYGASVVADRNLVGKNEVALANALAAALDDAEAKPSDLGHINAHGLGAPEADKAEATALRAVLGNETDQTPVLGLKSYFGNLGAGSGVVELIGSLLAMKEGVLPATLNYETPDPDCPLNVAQEQGISPGNTFASINTTPQGQAAAVCIG